MSLAVNFLGREYAEAKLEIVEPAADRATIPLHFNPAEFKISKQNTYAEIPIPGLASPPLQFVRGGARTLAMDLLVDTSDELVSVRTKYVATIEGALAKNGKLHAPPILDFMWSEQVFRGVLTSLEISYVLFHHDGVPLRARLAVKMTEYAPVTVQVKDPQSSPDVEKRYVVRTGETLSSIAAAVYRDPARWREIAIGNGITDPRSVAPGTVLTIPRLTRDQR